MQGILFPPLDDEDSKGSKGDARDRALPQDIEDRFAKVRFLLREKVSEADEDAAKELKRKQEMAALDAATAVQEEVQRLLNGIAELEAVSAMQRQQPFNVFVRNERADYNTDSDDEDDHLPFRAPADNNIVFPSLAYMINAVEPDADGDTRSIRSSSQASERGESEALVATQDILCDA